MAEPPRAEAKKNGWPVCIAIVDYHGDLVYFERMDNTQLGSVSVAVDKARTAAKFKRSTKLFDDAVAGGRNAILRLGDATPIQGGCRSSSTQVRRGDRRVRRHLTAGRAGRFGRAGRAEVSRPGLVRNPAGREQACFRPFRFSI